MIPYTESLIEISVAGTVTIIVIVVLVNSFVGKSKDPKERHP
jgi:hypothetical protein